MVETPQDELSLRDIVEVLRRHRVYLWAFPLILAALALIYGFLIAEPTYASTATLSVAPVQVQAQLEQRIQVQQATPITFEGLKALALSEETVGEVWEALRKEGKLPPGGHRVLPVQKEGPFQVGPKGLGAHPRPHGVAHRGVEGEGPALLQAELA